MSTEVTIEDALWAGKRVEYDLDFDSDDMVRVTIWLRVIACGCVGAIARGVAKDLLDEDDELARIAFFADASPMSPCKHGSKPNISSNEIEVFPLTNLK